MNNTERTQPVTSNRTLSQVTSDIEQIDREIAKLQAKRANLVHEIRSISDQAQAAAMKYAA